MLAHIAIGDKKAQVVSDSLVGMICIEELDLSENSLTDVGVSIFMTSILTLRRIVVLDLSFNTIGNYSAVCDLAKLLLILICRSSQCHVTEVLFVWFFIRFSAH